MVRVFRRNKGKENGFFLSLDIVVVIVEKHILLNNLFCKITSMAYFGFFWLNISTYMAYIATKILLKHRIYVFDLLLRVRVFVDYF